MSNLPLLPPSVDFSSLLKLIIEATDALSRYDAAFGNMKNSSFLLNIAQSNEAVLSSRIEGTQASLEEVLQSAEKSFDESKKQDIEEIINYRKALEEGRRLIDEGRTLSEETVKRLHKTLLSSGRGSQFDPGQYKQRLNWIGRVGCRKEEAIYVPPPPNQIPALMNNLFEYLHSEVAHQHVVQIAIGHYQFESIHPFSDGNGRIGRLLIPLYLYEKRVISAPNLYVSEFFQEHKQDYYEYLNDVHTTNNWVQWLHFFLVAVRNQSRILKNRADQIEASYDEISGALIDFNSIFAQAFLEALFKQPVFTAQSIQRLTPIKHIKTVYTLIEKFQSRGYIEYIDTQQRHRLYRFKKLLDIIQNVR